MHTHTHTRIYTKREGERSRDNQQCGTSKENKTSKVPKRGLRQSPDVDNTLTFAASFICFIEIRIFRPDMMMLLSVATSTRDG